MTAARSLLLCAVFGLSAAAAHPGQGTNWNRFRGPNGSGVAEVSNLPIEFGPGQNVIWKTDLPSGYSSPILTDQHIFLTAFEEHDLLTLCLDRETGQVVWTGRVPRKRREKLDSRNNPASPSPAIDERFNVYVFFGEYGLVSYDVKGNERWRLPLGPFSNLYGMGASPIVSGSTVLLVCDQQLNSFLIAVDKELGTVLWRVDRPEVASGHSSPVLYHPASGDTQLLVPGSFALVAYSVESGEKLWWVNGLSFEMKSTPVLYQDLVFINGYGSPLNQPDRIVPVPDWEDIQPQWDQNADRRLSPEESPNRRIRAMFSFFDRDGNGFLEAADWDYYRAAMATRNGMLGIRLGGSGDMTDSSLVWQYSRTVPQLPSPLLYREVLYMINDGGVATSFRPATGEVIARGRIKGALDKFFASPVAGDNKIFLVSETGKVAVLKPDGSLTVEAVNDLGAHCYATPALAEGRIYIRTTESLYAFGTTEGSHGP